MELFLILLKQIAIMALLAAVEILSSFVQARSMGKMGLSIITRIRADIFERLQQLSFDYFDNRPDGKIVVRVTEYINGLADFFSNYVMMFAIYVVKLVVVTVFMLSLSPMLTLIVFASVVPMMVIIFRLRSRLRKMYAAHRAKNSNRTAFLVESIMGEQIVKNYNRIEINRDIYRQIHEESVNMWWDIVKRSRLNGPVVQLFWNAGTLCIFGAALALILGGDVGITAGGVITFTSYMGAFQDPLAQLSTIIQELAQVSSNLEQVFDTIDYPAEIQDKENCVVLKNVRGKVDFQDVTFCYEENTDILRHFTLHVKPGETIALVGPTGAGKTTAGLAILRLIPSPPGVIVGGSIKVNGDEYLSKSEKEMEAIRGKAVSMIFQDPMTALNPVFRVEEQIAESLIYHENLDKKDALEKARDMLEAVGIPRERGKEYPHQFSGGMKQRVVIAIALACSPSILIADEPTTALDVTIQAQVLEMMKSLKEKYQTSMLLITHDLGVVAEICDDVSVIYAGTVVEHGSLEDVFNHPRHPYTEGLFNSLPDMENPDAKLKPIKGLMPDPSNLPAGCAFCPRCEYAMPVCETEKPSKSYRCGEHYVLCHLYRDGGAAEGRLDGR